MKPLAVMSNDPPVLGEIRRALGRRSSTAPAPLEAFVQATGEPSREEIVPRFIEEATAVRCQVQRVRSAMEAVARIADICRTAGSGEIAVSDAPLLSELNLSRQLAESGLDAMVVSEFGPGRREELIARLAGCRTGITAIDYAIAETGTIILSSDEERALLVSLLPPVHIAVLREQQIKASMAAAVSWLKTERMGRTPACRAANFITGPSRTSDVELTLSIGVHGPKELHLIIL